MNHFALRPLSFPDESSDPSEALAPPITQLLDSRIDPLRGRGQETRRPAPSAGESLLLSLPSSRTSSSSWLLSLLYGCCRSATRGRGCNRAAPAAPPFLYLLS